MQTNQLTENNDLNQKKNNSIAQSEINKTMQK